MLRSLAYRTEQTYLDWRRRFLAFHQAITPANLATGHLKSFLEYLAVERNVSSATQNQALSAVLFLYQTVLGHETGRTCARAVGTGPAGESVGCVVAGRFVCEVSQRGCGVQ